MMQKLDGRARGGGLHIHMNRLLRLYSELTYRLVYLRSHDKIIRIERLVRSTNQHVMEPTEPIRPRIPAIVHPASCGIGIGIVSYFSKVLETPSS